MAKVALTCNGTKAENVYPCLILASSAVASGDDVYIYFTADGAPAMVKGELEKMNNMKGLPDIIEMYEGILLLGGKIYICELGLEVYDLKKEDFREDVVIGGATTFINEITDATITFSF